MAASTRNNTTNFSFAETLLEVSETKKCRCWKCLRERRLACILSLHVHDRTTTDLGYPSQVLEILILSVLRQNRVQFMHELRGGLARLFLSNVASKLSARILCSHKYKTITWTWQFPVQDLHKRVFCLRHKIPSNCWPK